MTPTIMKEARKRLRRKDLIRVYKEWFSEANIEYIRDESSEEGEACLVFDVEYPVHRIVGEST